MRPHVLIRRWACRASNAVYTTSITARSRFRARSWFSSSRKFEPEAGSQKGLARSLKGQARVRGTCGQLLLQRYEGFSIVTIGTSQVVTPNTVV